MKYDDDLIANIEETPININMPPNYTITKKNVIISTQGQEKCQCSILLTILADGKKLSPLIIFKGKNYNNKIIKELNDNFYIKEKKIFCIK